MNDFDVMTKKDIGIFLKMEENEVKYLLYKKKELIDKIIVKKGKSNYWVNKKKLLSVLGLEE